MKMPTLNQVRTKVDDWLTARWPTFRDRQIAYQSVNGRYWQGKRTHTAELLYTGTVDAEAIANNLTSTPTDQVASWLTLIPEWNAILLPALFICDTYNGPLGQGFVLSIWVRHNGTVYMRAQNYALNGGLNGGETWRTYAWQAVTDAPV
jgi:hypothetical protein